MSKVLAKEVAPFNVRVLTVSLGGFDTNMPNASSKGTNPLPADYKDSMADKLMTVLGNGTFTPDGDKNKAVKAVYEVVMGEGVGKGHLDERFLPLGRDLAVRVEQVVEYYNHSMQVFGGICNNVYKEG